jgi:hypothetical protein
MKKDIGGIDVLRGTDGRLPKFVWPGGDPKLCAHPTLQVNGDGICCDCGAKAS